MAPRLKFSKPITLAHAGAKPIDSVHSQKKGPPIFLNKVFAITGDFGSRNTHVSIERWISYHSGQVRREVTEETTHLICSIEDYKKKAPHVKKALTLGKRKCHIVVFDWLVDCLVRKSGQRVKSLSEKAYLIETVLKRIRRAENAKVRHTEEYIASIKSTTELADHRLYSVYYDTTFFKYEVRLTRVRRITERKFLMEKYTIYLFESYAKPALYMVGAKYQKGGEKAKLHREMCFPKEFHNAFADFKRLFKKKTEIEWDQRLDGLHTTEEAFKYTPPDGGKPQGVMPAGWTAPKQKKPGKGMGNSYEDESSTDESGGIVTDPELTEETDSNGESEDSSSGEGSEESSGDDLDIMARKRSHSSAGDDDCMAIATGPRRLTLTLKKGNGLNG